MNQIKFGELVDAQAFISSFATIAWSQNVAWRGDQYENIMVRVRRYRDLLYESDLSVSGVFADRTISLLESATPLPDGRIAIQGLSARDNLKSALMQLNNGVGVELESKIYLIINPKYRAFYEQKEPLFGSAVVDAFHSSEREISEAGKCIALGRWTAAVVHLMRALEPALLALQDAVQVNVPKEQWDQVINQIESKIREITAKTHGKPEEQWFSEAAIHFRFIKNGWRNYANHNKDSYNEEEALAIFESVKALMRQLATRLSEKP